MVSSTQFITIANRGVRCPVQEDISKVIGDIRRLGPAGPSIRERTNPFG
jgi:hypothetical protein